MGKGKDTSTPREEHVSRPLSSLKDPALFGPPPKHVRYHGGIAVPDRTTPDRSGIGAPLSQAQIREQNARLEAEQQRAQAEAEERARPPPPPRPYVADTSGLSTGNLPPPPVRRINSSAESTTSNNSRPKPSLPPRLPPRRDSPSQPPTPPPAYSPIPVQEAESDGYINQHAASRLTQAGVSVPGFGIGGANGGRDSAPSPLSRTNATAPVNELQARFSRMSTSSPTAQETPTQGTTLASPQTSQSHYSPSAGGTDSQGISSSFNNFRDRHSDQIDAGKKKISDINEKYGITKRINGYFEHPPAKSSATPPPPPPPHPNANQPSSNVDASPLNKRKPPPPPPPKKPGMRTTPVNPANAPSPSPPPLPLGTKPR